MLYGYEHFFSLLEERLRPAFGLMLHRMWCSSSVLANIRCSIFRVTVTGKKKQQSKKQEVRKGESHYFIVIIINIFLNGLDHLTCSGINTLPLFPGASTISSFSRFVVEGVFRKSGVVHSFKMVNPVLFVFGSHVLYSRDI